jgi:hypothetical protein
VDIKKLAHAGPTEQEATSTTSNEIKDATTKEDNEKEQVPNKVEESGAN